MRERLYNLSLTLTFAALLALPLVGMPFGWNPSPNVVERRARAEVPAWGTTGLVAFAQSAAAYFEDHFAFRDGLVYLHSRSRADAFGVSPSDRVLVGRDGWLFYTGSEQVRDAQGLSPATDEECSRWQDVLEGRRAWLAERGITYYFVLVPNKMTIYPDQLPAGVLTHADETRADGIAAHLRTHTEVPFIDLRPTLHALREQRPAYYPFGTHWNHDGAFAGYRDVALRLAQDFPAIQPFTEDDFRRTPATGEYITHMMGIREQDWLPSPVTRLQLKSATTRPVAVTVPHICETEQWPATAFETPGHDLRAVVVHDSFFVDLVRPTLAEHFGRSVWIRCNQVFDYERLAAIVAQEQPDIVIEERVERFMKITPADHPEFARARAGRTGEE